MDYRIFSSIFKLVLAVIDHILYWRLLAAPRPILAGLTSVNDLKSQSRYYHGKEQKSSGNWEDCYSNKLYDLIENQDKTLDSVDISTVESNEVKEKLDHKDIIEYKDIDDLKNDDIKIIRDVIQYIIDILEEHYDEETRLRSSCQQLPVPLPHPHPGDQSPTGYSRLSGSSHPSGHDSSKNSAHYNGYVRPNGHGKIIGSDHYGGHAHPSDQGHSKGSVHFSGYARPTDYAYSRDVERPSGYNGPGRSAHTSGSAYDHNGRPSGYIGPGGSAHSSSHAHPNRYGHPSSHGNPNDHSSGLHPGGFVYPGDNDISSRDTSDDEFHMKEMGYGNFGNPKTFYILNTSQFYI